MPISDFVDDKEERRQLYLTAIEYTSETGKPITHLFCRDANQKKYHLKVSGHRPSFFVPRDEYTTNMSNHNAVHRTETTDGDGKSYEDLDGNELVRVYTYLPKQVADLRKHFDTTYEADVFYDNRWLIDNDIYTGLSISEDLFDDADPKGKGSENTTVEVRHSDECLHRTQSNTVKVSLNVSDVEPCEAPTVEPRTLTVDIEVGAENGVPSTELAEWPITTLVAHDSYSDEYVGWLLRHDSHDEFTDSELAEAADVSAAHIFDDEAEMLNHFNQWIGEREFDVFTGWFSSSFDYPYLINRCRKKSVYSYQQWSPLGDVWITNSWKEPVVKGATMFDMLEGYKKTQIHELDNKSLDAVAEKELGESKIAVEEGHTEMWKDDPKTFLKYNKVDVELVVKIEQSQDILNTFAHIRSIAGCQLDAPLGGNIDLMDVYFLRRAKNRGYRLPTATETEEGWYYGAKVFDMLGGVSENVVYFDLACFTPDHMVLTPDGVKNITDFEVGDSIYTLDQETHEIVEDTVAETWEYEYSGNIHSVSSKSNDFTVTPNHNIYTAPCHRGPESNLSAEDFSLTEIAKSPKNFQYTPLHSSISGNNRDSYNITDDIENSFACIYITDGRTARHEIPKEVHDVATISRGYETVDERNEKWAKYLVPIDTYRKYEDRIKTCDSVYSVKYKAGKQCKQSPVVFDMDNLIQLVAWYISEGSVGTHTPHRVDIANTESKHMDSISDLVERMGWSYTSAEKSIQFTDGVMAEWLQSMFGSGSYNKRIADEFLSLNGEQSKLLLETLIDGDGTNTSENRCTYYTASRELAEDVVELATRAGHRAKIYSRERSKDEYDVHINKSTASIDREKNGSVEKYDGNVYCVTGEENNVIMAGKNDTYNWIGQSLYPNLIEMLNVSPETLIGTNSKQNNPHGYIDTRSNSVKQETEPEYEPCYYSNKGEGFVASLVSDLIDMKNEYRGTEKYGAVKRVTNSVYGVLSDGDSYGGRGFRLFDWRMGESITLSGRKVIDFCADTAMEYAQANGYGGEDVVLGDTDGFGIPLDGCESQEDIIDAAHEIATHINAELPQFCAEEFGVDTEDNTMDIEVESLFERVFTGTAKKRYATLEVWNDSLDACASHDDPVTRCEQCRKSGWLENPTLSVKGYEYVRSDVATVTKEAQEYVFNAIMHHPLGKAEQLVYNYINWLVDAIEEGEYAVEKIGRPKGIGQSLEEYGSTNRTPQSTYRGARYANDVLYEGEVITEGDKPYMYYLDGMGGEYRSTYPSDWDVKGANTHVDAIAVDDASDLPPEAMVDTEKMIEKTLRDPLEAIFEPLGWSFDEAITDGEQLDIENFM